MPWWADLLDVVALLAIIALAVFAFLFVRRRTLSRGGGTFDCSARTRRPGRSSPTASRGWELGIGRYDGDRLEWFRVFSFSPRPKVVLDRSIEVVGRRVPHGAEAFSLYSGHIVITVRIAGSGTMELAMSESALTALLAWTEAAPPGHQQLLG